MKTNKLLITIILLLVVVIAGLTYQIKVEHDRNLMMQDALLMLTREMGNVEYNISTELEEMKGTLGDIQFTVDR